MREDPKVRICGGAVIVNQHNPEEHILRNILSNLLSSNSLNKMKSNMNNYDVLNPENKIFEIMNTIS